MLNIIIITFGIKLNFMRRIPFSEIKQSTAKEKKQWLNDDYIGENLAFFFALW